ncbi:MAG: TlpA family protein disulfide reductase [Bacteroidales bacterium]|nr:TlpA family protein disulfide reductase [Bacteroidales bacterium]
MILYIILISPIVAGIIFTIIGFRIRQNALKIIGLLLLLASAVVYFFFKSNQPSGESKICQVSDAEGDTLLTEIVSNYSGRVVLVDFWDTWCSPCQIAMTRMDASGLKSGMMSDGVAFVYIADESSPEDEWRERITEICGDHYRLSRSQILSLYSIFEFEAIPSYVIIGADGEVKQKCSGAKMDFIENALKTELDKK